MSGSAHPHRKCYQRSYKLLSCMLGQQKLTSAVWMFQEIQITGVSFARLCSSRSSNDHWDQCSGPSLMPAECQNQNCQARTASPWQEAMQQEILQNLHSSSCAWSACKQKAVTNVTSTSTWRPVTRSGLDHNQCLQSISQDICLTHGMKRQPAQAAPSFCPSASHLPLL